MHCMCLVTIRELAVDVCEWSFLWPYSCSGNRAPMNMNCAVWGSELRIQRRKCPPESYCGSTLTDILMAKFWGPNAGISLSVFMVINLQEFTGFFFFWRGGGGGKGQLLSYSLFCKFGPQTHCSFLLFFCPWLALGLLPFAGEITAWVSVFTF